MKAVLYARVSSREQKEGYSLEAQIKLGRDYVKRQQITLIKEFAVAESAKNSGREAFKEMISFLREHNEIGIIIVEKVDRLLRGDLTDRVAIDDLMNEKGKEIHFVKEGLVLSREAKSAQKLHFDIQVALARHYLNNLSDEVRKSYDVMVDEGRYPHMPPIGFKAKLGNYLAIPDPERTQFIIKAFELASTGNMTLIAINEELYKQGFRSRTGKKLAKSDISDMLHNPFYYGSFKWKGEIKKGLHQPLISKILFDKVQEVLSPKGKSKGYKHKFNYAGGLLQCASCGNGITAELQKGHVYYRCTKPKGSKSCPQPYIREEKLEEQLTEVVKAISLNSETVDLIKDILRSSHNEEEEYHKRSLEALQSQYISVKSKLDRLLDAYIDGGITKEVYNEKQQQLENELLTIDEQISKHKKADQAYFQEIENFLEVAYQAPTLFESSSPALKREFLKFIVSNLSLKEKKVVPTYRLPFNLLVEY